jgi:hypothetical protein
MGTELEKAAEQFVEEWLELKAAEQFVEERVVLLRQPRRRRLRTSPNKSLRF